MSMRLLPMLGLLTLFLANSPGQAADKLPAEVEAIPSDSALIFTVRVGELWDSEAGQAIRKQSPKAVEDLSKEIRTNVGCDLEQIVRISIVASDIGPGGNEPVFLVSTRKAVDKTAVVKGLLPEAKEEKIKNKIFYTQKDPRPFRREGVQVIHFITDSFYIQGLKQDVEHWLDRNEDKPGVMQPARVAAAKDHVVFALNIEKLADTFTQVGMPPEVEPYKALFAGKLGMVRGNMDKLTARAELTVEFTTEKDAMEGLKAGNELLKFSRTSLAEALKMLPKPFKGGPAEKLFGQFEAGLKEGKLEQAKTTLKGSMSATSDAETLTKGAAQLFTEMRASAGRSEVTNRVQQLIFAMYNYESANRGLPPAAIYSKEGKPLLSWRVLLLPHIGHKKLYEEFKLDEPWDSDHNKKLLEKMPDQFKMPGADAQNKANETFYQVFTGKDTVFAGPRSMKLQGIADGTSNTILIVEANKAVPWTKPEDLVYDAQKPVPKLGFSRADHFIAAYADGSVRYHKTKMKEDHLRLRITPNDGQPIPAEADDK